MATAIPEQYKDLLEKKAFAHLGTTLANGNPQVTPVWFDHDGTNIRVNSAKGRLKDKNMRSRPQVALAISDPENPYRYMEIRGKVAQITEEGADAHIDSLAKRYLGQDKYPFRQPGEVRVIYTIVIEHVSTMG